jgi:hypothetical protein
MGNLFFQPVALDEDLLQVHFEQTTPIIGIPLKPSINCKIMSPIQFLWFLVDKKNSSKIFKKLKKRKNFNWTKY